MNRKRILLTHPTARRAAVVRYAAVAAVLGKMDVHTREAAVELARGQGLLDD